MLEKLKFEHQNEFVFVVPEEVFKLEEAKEKPEKKLHKANFRNYAKYHEQKMDLNKLKAKLDAKNMGFYYSRMY